MLKPTHSDGPDGFPNAFLKQPLAAIFDASFKSGVLPTCWLDAHVKPVYKKGATSKPENYRPILLTCFWCRTMERFINHKILDYLHSNGLLIEAQHGSLRNTHSKL